MISPVASRGRYLRRCASLPIGVDRIHHQRGLHRHHRAVAGIDALDLARDQPVGDGAEAGAAVLLRQRGAEQAELAHLGDDLAVEALLAVGGEHARKQLVLRIAARAVAHHALLLGQLAFEVERVLPVEGGVGDRRGRRLRVFGGGERHGNLLAIDRLSMVYRTPDWSRDSAPRTRARSGLALPPRRASLTEN